MVPNKQVKLTNFIQLRQLKPLLLLEQQLALLWVLLFTLPLMP